MLEHTSGVRSRRDEGGVRGPDIAWQMPCTLHGLFERAVGRHPHQPAVVSGDLEVTYAELAEDVSRVAASLLEGGVRVGDVVAVRLLRSVDLVAALLAVLKVGAAYLPIDTEAPPERVKALLADGPKALLVGDATQTASIGCDIATLDMTGASPAPDASYPDVSGDQLAYTMPTSGTTGRPKRVMVPHRAVVNRILWGQSEYPLGSADRVLQGARCVFDFSVWELFAPLAAGAAVVLAEDGSEGDPSHLVELIGKQRITAAHFVPELLEAVLEDPEFENAAGCLRYVFSGGDVLSPRTARRLAAATPAEVYNQYGPTETCIDSTFHRYRPAPEAEAAATVPIGRPIANSRVVVVDEDLREVSAGDPGELAIAGEGLAWGYQGQPARTAERFVPDSSGVSGGRLYLTGDRARIREDGAVEFLGRLDRQVKVRGVRVELAEVETTLRLHPAIRDAAVAATGQAERPLVAAYVCRVGCTPSEVEVREYLAARLPTQMVPSVLVAVRELPRTPDGDLDHASVVAEAQSAQAPVDVAVDPDETPVQHRLIEIWAELFDQRPGANEHFFDDLGGHSLLGAQLIAKVNREFGVRVPLREFFREPTIVAVVNLVEKAKGRAAERRDRPADTIDPESMPASARESEAESVRCLHALLEPHIAAQPESVAVVDGEREYTYRELDVAASELATRLASCGVGPEHLVAICLERSFDMVAAMLGTLRAGGAYVPLDPEYPPQRLGTLLRDSAPTATVTRAGLRDRLGMVAGATLLVDGTDEASTRTEPPTRQPQPGNLAYVIYTSGSTGTPKGVQVAHANAVALLDAALPKIGAGPTDVWAAFHSFAFDFSVWEIWGALATGARLVLVPPRTARSPDEFWRLLQRHRVTVLNQTPSALLGLGRAAKCVPTGGTALRVVVCGGEALQAKHLRDWHECFAGAGPQIVNMYGITETTVHVTYQPIPSESGPVIDPVPIGGPLPHLELYILDSRMQPVPPGVPGEMYVGGEGVSRGYLRQSAQTAERFVPHPFGGGGRRLYRTGDQAQYDETGTIWYLGRLDQQLSVRGFRVEPGEVEAAINGHPGVAAAFVAPRAGDSGTELCAYILSDDPPTETGLRSFLRARLPAHMVPSVVEYLRELPLDANGKLDRRALASVSEQAETGDDLAAPRTPTEEMLASIWATALGRGTVDVDEDFLALGGHSLTAVQIQARISALMGVRIPVASVFEWPTVRKLAQALDDGLVDASAAVAEIPRVGASSAPLSSAQQRLLFMHGLDPEGTSNTFFYPFWLRGPVDGSALRRAVHSLVERHAVLRTRLVWGEAGPVQEPGPVPGGAFQKLEVDTTSASSRRELALKQCEREFRRPFDLSAGEVFRVRLLEVGPEETLMLVSIHHVVHDAWSFAVLCRDLSELYAAAVEAREPSLPELAIDYSDYAIWQQERNAGALGAARVRGAVERLSGAPPLSTLPLDWERGDVQSLTGVARYLRLPGDLVSGIRDLARRHGATLYVTLLTAFKLAVMRASGSTDLLIGAPVANRTRVETEDMLGCFINTIVIRSDLSGDPTFVEALRQVRRAALEAYTDQEIPFEDLVRAVGPQRDAGHPPLVQMMFNMHNMESTHLTLKGLKVEKIPWPDEVAPMDLSVFMQEQFETLLVKVVRNTALFSADRVGAVLDDFVWILRAVSEGAADDHVSRLPRGAAGTADALAEQE